VTVFVLFQLVAITQQVLYCCNINTCMLYFWAHYCCNWQTFHATTVVMFDMLFTDNTLSFCRLCSHLSECFACHLCVGFSNYFCTFPYMLIQGRELFVIIGDYVIWCNVMINFNSCPFLSMNLTSNYCSLVTDDNFFDKDCSTTCFSALYAFLTSDTQAFYTVKTVLLVSQQYVSAL